MSGHPPICLPWLPRAHGPGRPAGPRRAARPATIAVVAAVLGASVATGCAGPAPVGPSTVGPSPVPPGVAGLLVAAGGPLRITDEGGGLVPFDGPSAASVAVTAAAGVVVATADDGAVAVSLPGPAPREWRPLELAPIAAGAVRLLSLAPDGRSIAVVVGDPQGPSFDLRIVDPGTGTTRSLSVPRGLNGAPAWLGPGTVAVDVIEADGSSAIASVEIASGAVTDRRGTGTIVAASADGEQVAIDDASTGDVLVGDRAAWESEAGDGMIRLAGPGAVGVDHLAMSPDGARLAVVRRGDGGVGVELLRSCGSGLVSGPEPEPVHRRPGVGRVADVTDVTIAGRRRPGNRKGADRRVGAFEGTRAGRPGAVVRRARRPGRRRSIPGRSRAASRP